PFPLSFFAALSFSVASKTDRSSTGNSETGRSEEAAALDDRVLQRADAIDEDPDSITGLEAEFIRRHDAGARQEHDPVGEAIVPAQPCDQVLEAAGHPRDTG